MKFIDYLNLTIWLILYYLFYALYFNHTLKKITKYFGFQYHVEKQGEKEYYDGSHKT